jgi:hypothetical protein
MSLEECNTKTQRHEGTKSEDEISHEIIGAAIEVHRTTVSYRLLRVFGYTWNIIMNSLAERS